MYIVEQLYIQDYEMCCNLPTKEEGLCQWTLFHIVRILLAYPVSVDTKNLHIFTPFGLSLMIRESSMTCHYLLFFYYYSATHRPKIIRHFYQHPLIAVLWLFNSSKHCNYQRILNEVLCWKCVYGCISRCPLSTWLQQGINMHSLSRGKGRGPYFEVQSLSGQ